MINNIFVSKNTIINSNIKSKLEYRFIFMDNLSKKIFLKNNPHLISKTFLIDEIQIHKALIGRKFVYFVYVLPKLIELNVKEIYIYDDNVFPEKIITYNENLMEIFKNLKIERKEEIVILTSNFFKKNKLKYPVLLSKKIIDCNPELIAIEHNFPDIYNLCGAIKVLNPNIPIVIYGNSLIPIRTLMSNPVDFFLKNENFLELLNGIKNKNLRKVKGLYYYDKYMGVKINK